MSGAVAVTAAMATRKGMTAMRMTAAGAAAATGWLRGAMVAALILPAAGTAASAGQVQAIPTNRLAADGSFGPVLEIYRNGVVQAFSVAKGEIPPAAVLDGPRAIDWIRRHFNLDPARDRIVYCPSGTLGVTCNDSSDPTALILYWP